MVMIVYALTLSIMIVIEHLNLYSKDGELIG